MPANCYTRPPYTIRHRDGTITVVRNEVVKEQPAGLKRVELKKKRKK